MNDISDIEERDLIPMPLRTHLDLSRRLFVYGDVSAIIALMRFGSSIVSISKLYIQESTLQCPNILYYTLIMSIKRWRSKFAIAIYVSYILLIHYAKIIRVDPIYLL